ncbi:MAG: hypothetical protein JWO67_1557 [Streptosporangiaceae bacterium]|nr:hypothetical protein [Streptosporangiaceae bacterium]
MTTGLAEIDQAELEQVDVSELTPTEIAKALIVLTRQMYAKVRELRELGEKSAKAKKEAKVAYAHAFLAAQGPMDVRKQEAELAAAEARFVADVADQEVSACKEALKVMHATVDVGRSLSATTRDEMKLAGVGGA